MRFKLIPFFLIPLLLTCCSPPASPEATSPPIEILTTSTPTEVLASVDGAIVVNNTASSGPGSLRQALLDAQYGDTITFDPGVFPPDTPATIYVIDQEMPGINIDNLTLDASNAGVILDGSQLEGDWIAGLQIISSSHVRIMGLQLSHFPGPGIAISGNSTHNVIGGDRNLGTGPWGQGNLLSNNIVGLDIASEGTLLNTITGNLIGVDLEGSHWLGNEGYGIHVWEGSHENTIGSDNIIKYNDEYGIYLDPGVYDQNTVIDNQIYGNAIGIGYPEMTALFDFDLAGGTVAGAACPDCRIEIYSTSSWGVELEGSVLEGETTADENGVFSFDKGEPFTGPYLTARTTNLNGRASRYYTFPLTSGTEFNLVMQAGNALPRQQYLLEAPPELADNHLANQYDSISSFGDYSDFTYIYSQGLTRARISLAGIEPDLVDWNKPEFSLSQSQEEHFTRLAEHDIIVTYVLMFWDKETYPNGEGAPCARFKTEEEVERWLEYVRFTVEHLKDRVKYFEIWNEPDIENFCPKWIMLDDYINLIKRTAPVIREVAPEAKIVIGGVSKTYYPGAQNYLFGLLRPDVMPLVDVISFHPLYGESPKYSHERDYYYNYPNFLQRIMDTAVTNGFDGEFHADEVGWSSQPMGGQSGEFSFIETNKYFLRAVMLHRGLGIDLGLRGGYYTTRRVTTLMAGVEPAEFPVEINSQASLIMSYTFNTAEGDRLIAVWTNGVAIDHDPGVTAAITIPGFTASDVSVIDLLNNLEQNLVFEDVEGNLVIENLLVRDYPLVIRLAGEAP
jgi:hypothetical protein